MQLFTMDVVALISAFGSGISMTSPTLKSSVGARKDKNDDAALELIRPSAYKILLAFGENPMAPLLPKRKPGGE